jgi:hypothetical protein
MVRTHIGIGVLGSALVAGGSPEAVAAPERSHAVAAISEMPAD